MTELIDQTAAFRAAFARAQAIVTVPVPGGAVVADPDFPSSQEHNQLLLDGVPGDPAELPALAARVLGDRRTYRITVLDEAFGEAAAPALRAAGYRRETEVVLARSTDDAVPPAEPAVPVGLPELRPALLRYQEQWLPGDELAEVRRQLTDRRSRRRRGAAQVEFLAVRGADGAVAGWGDLYLDPARGLAQLEDVATAARYARQGHADRLLATALARAAAAGCHRLFLLADAEDWPQHWYGRRGFVPIGRTHAFVKR
ncbi:GNAT family N-acetyltransferase [Kitasatospora sp. NPDC058965]|uniref:GNAT family N-acetyltransferase n=1 Tax=Kitasatospora sp. NPDC058965 TaxID=3346682 RepID=UPI003684D6EE